MKKLAILFASALAALIIGEVVVRLFVPEKKFVTVSKNENFLARLEEERASPVDLEFDIGPGTGFYINTPAGMRMRAMANVVVKAHRLHGRPINIRTNSLGLRGPELGTGELPRIMFLGDSITFGEYVSEENTFVSKVGQYFAASDSPVEVVNAGISAVGLPNELSLLTELGPLINPDVVVYGFYLNDIQASKGLRVWKLPKYLFGSHLARFVASEVPGILQRVDKESFTLEELEALQQELETHYPTTVGHPELVFNLALKKYIWDWGSAFIEPAWERLNPMLRELDSLCKENNQQMLWIAFPSYPQVTNQSVQDFPQLRLKKIAKELGVPLLDTLPLLREAERSNPKLLFLDQCHHTVLGNDLIAMWVHEFLSKELSAE